MPRSTHSIRLTLFLIVLGLLLAGCPAKSPEDEVAANRARYTVRLENFFPQAPMEEETMMEEGAEGEAAEGEPMAEEAAAEATAEAAAAEGEAAEGEATEDEIMEDPADAAPASTSIVFDFYVVYDGSDPLPGITLDFSHADASGTEKASWRHFIEVPGMAKGEARQATVTLDVENYAEGDLFSAQLDEYVAPEDQAEYPEFASAGQ